VSDVFKLATEVSSDLSKPASIPAVVARGVLKEALGMTEASGLGA